MFLIISRSVLCRMRIVSHKSFRDNQNKFFFSVTFIISIIIIIIILPFMRQCGKIIYGRAGHG